MTDETLADKRRRQAKEAERNGDLGMAWTCLDDANALDAKDARIAELERKLEKIKWPCEVTRVHGTQYVIASNLQGGPALYWENADATEWTWLRHLDLDFTPDHQGDDTTTA